MPDTKLKDIPFTESTIETVDASMFDWLDNKLNLSVTTNQGFKKVPIIWVSAERAFLTKNNKETRDKHGTMSYPLISIERVNIAKDPTKKGTAWGNIDPETDAKRGSAAITIARRIKQDKTSEFASVDANRTVGQLNFPRKNEKVVYETISIPMPVYVMVTYNIHLRTLYQSQMNELMQPFINKTGGINYFLLKNEGHRYEAFVSSEFDNQSNVKNMGTEERRFTTIISIKVLAYLIGLGKNQETPIIVHRENAVSIAFPKERIIVGDLNEVKGGTNYIGISNIEGVKK